MPKLSRRSLISTSFATLSAFSIPAIAQPNQTKNWNYTFDAVVVGSGASGLTAATRLAQAGMKVLLTEKLPFTGGSTLLSVGGYAVPGSKYQKEKGIKDSPQIYYEDMLRVGSHKNDPELVKAFTAKSLEAFEWMLSNGGKLKSENVSKSGSVARNMTVDCPPTVKALTAAFKKAGGTLWTASPAKELLWDEKNKIISGVLIEHDKKLVAVKANLGVILASGGFSRNKKLLAKYVPRMANANAISGGGSQGDGLLMAQAYGADVADMPYIKATYGFAVNSKSGQEVWYPFRFGAIVVNKKGQRICDESISKKDIGDKALEQEDGIAYCVYDTPINAETIEDHGNDRYNYLKGLNVFYSGDSLEEVAKKAGIDPAGLIATVKKYNEDVEKNGFDSVFGRKHCVDVSGKLVPINKGPFYIYPSRPVLVATYCGVKVDPTTQVIDVFGKPIKGLYAAGEVAGGVHGTSFLASSAISKSFTMGYMVADTLIKKRKSL